MSSWEPQQDEENSLWNANPHYYSIDVLLRLLHPYLGACCQWNSNPYELNTMETDSLGSKIYCLCWGNDDIKSHQFTVWSLHKKMLFKRFPTIFCYHCVNTACRLVATPKLRRYSNLKSLTLPFAWHHSTPLSFYTECLVHTGSFIFSQLSQSPVCVSSSNYRDYVRKIIASFQGCRTDSDSSLKSQQTPSAGLHLKLNIVLNSE